MASIQDCSRSASDRSGRRRTVTARRATMDRPAGRARARDARAADVAAQLARARSARVLVGAAALPLLPVARAAEAARAAGAGRRAASPATPAIRRAATTGGTAPSTASSARCCGGSQSACPPGTEMSPVTWIGTCRNPGRRQGLRHLVQRLLRADALRALPLQAQRGRASRCTSRSKSNDLALVLRDEEPRRALLGGGRARGCDGVVSRRARAALVVALAARAASARAPITPARRLRRSTARAAISPTAAGTPGSVPGARGLGGALPRRRRAAASISPASPASRRRRSTTRLSRRCSTGCWIASTPPTCRPSSRPTPRRRWAASGSIRWSTSMRRGSGSSSRSKRLQLPEPGASDGKDSRARGLREKPAGLAVRRDHGRPMPASGERDRGIVLELAGVSPPPSAACLRSFALPEPPSTSRLPSAPRRPWPSARASRRAAALRVSGHPVAARRARPPSDAPRTHAGRRSARRRTLRAPSDQRRRWYR